MAHPTQHLQNAVHLLGLEQHHDRLHLQEVLEKIEQRRRERQPTSQLVTQKKKLLRNIERRAEEITRFHATINKRKGWGKDDG